MNPRIQNLRKQSTETKPFITAERAQLITQLYQKEEVKEMSIPVQRGMAFKYLLENKELCINAGELIVGERGPSPQATPTYPEICLHSIDDLNILNDRKKVAFLSNEKT